MIVKPFPDHRHDLREGKWVVGEICKWLHLITKVPQPRNKPLALVPAISDINAVVGPQGSLLNMFP